MMGGSVPTDKLVEALDLPFVIVRWSIPTTTSTVSMKTCASAISSMARACSRDCWRSRF